MPFSKLQTEAGMARSPDAAALLAGLLDSAMDAIVTADERQVIVMYNRAAEKLFGWPAVRVVGQPLDLLLPARFRAAHRSHVVGFGTTGVSNRRMGDGRLIHGVRADGTEFPMDASISQLDTPHGKLFTVILRDVSERIRAQQELAAFATESSAAREQEKSRIARELHDELAQSLTALKMDATWVRDHLATDPRAASARLGDMLAMLDASVAATRRIAADLRPLLLDDLGLVAAIEWLAQSFTERSGIACALDLDQALEPGEPHATAIFRMVQESLANVAKHASASRASVTLACAQGELALCVQDDGAGFAPDAPRKPHSMGLAGLRERAQMLGGSVVIDSAPGRGTAVKVRIPEPVAAPTTELGAGP